MGGSKSAQIGRALYWLFCAIAAVIVAYTAWFVFVDTAGEFKDRLLVGVASLMAAGVFFAAAKGVEAGLVGD